MDFVDLDLARRMEMAEAHACRACAESFQQQHRDFPVAVQEIAGSFAVFAGVDSPVTQAIGLGLHGDVSDTDLDRLGDFFRSRGAAAAVELCPLVPMSLYERPQNAVISCSKFRTCCFENSPTSMARSKRRLLA